MDEADRLATALKPLFGMVTILSEESTPFGNTAVKARNPVPIKTLMNLLGMPSGPCRRPLGRMNAAGLEKVLEIARRVQADSPEIFEPIARFFAVDINARLQNPSTLAGLAYTD